MTEKGNSQIKGDADPENEYQIQKAFETLARGKTVLMIAHWLSTIQNADCILVLDDGKIAERGTHQQLPGRQSIFHQPAFFISSHR